MIETALIAATIGVPLAALLLASAFESVRKVAHEASMAIVILSLCAWLIVVTPGHVTVVNLLSTNWLHVAGVPPVAVQWQLSVQPASVLLVIIGLLVMAVSARLGRTPAVRCHSTPSDWLLRQLLLTCGAFSADLVVILISWLVTDAVIDWQRTKVALPAPVNSDNAKFGGRAPLRLTSLLLLVAIVVLSARYRTTDVATLLEAVRSDERIDASAIRGGLAICLAAAIAFRCGQFPAVLWVKRLTAESSPVGIGFVLPILVPAFVLAARLSLLWRMAPEAGSLFASLGALTTVTMGLTACSTRRFYDVPTIVCVMLCGQALICCGSPVADAAVLSGLSMLMGILGMLFYESTSCTRTRSQQASFFGILAASWTPAALAGTLSLAGSGPSPDAAPTPGGVWWAMLLGQLLSSFALVRGALALRGQDEAGRVPQPDQKPSSVLSVLLAFAVMVCVAWAIGGGERLAAEGTTSDATPMPRVGFEFLIVGVLGVVLSGLLFRPLASFQQSLAQRFDSVLHVAREWWYVEELARFTIVGPLRVVAIVVEFIDRQLLGGGREDAWIQPGTRFANLIDSVREAEPNFYGIAIGWAVIGLLVALTLGLR